MEIYNLQEDLVEVILDEKLAERSDICKCDQCQVDMMVYALNRLPSRYVSKKRGETFSRLELADTQGRTSVLAAVVSAIKVVSESPRH
ncbi:late competence development ComFB family protein [candidate division CSSED10-310 bacterium]|uniref:Late competence development ComFB family protein n=1 Tax=candidate division CSSED10-310 bacterium TaxID=2855610 RepID=A0ABV6YYF2_UNCC1